MTCRSPLGSRRGGQRSSGGPSSPVGPTQPSTPQETGFSVLNTTFSVDGADLGPGWGTGSRTSGARAQRAATRATGGTEAAGGGGTGIFPGQCSYPPEQGSSWRTPRGPPALDTCCLSSTAPGPALPRPPSPSCPLANTPCPFPQKGSKSAPPVSRREQPWDPWHGIWLRHAVTSRSPALRGCCGPLRDWLSLVTPQGPAPSRHSGFAGRMDKKRALPRPWPGLIT